MALQLLAKGGFGAPYGGADAAGRHVEGGRDLGVAETAVAQHKGDGLFAGETGEGRAYPAALVPGDHGVGHVGGRVLHGGGLLAGGAAATGTEMVEGGVRGGHGQPARGLAGWDRGAPEAQE